MKKTKYDFTKELLVSLYKTKSQPEIAKELNCSLSTITRLFFKFGIKGRKPSDSTLLSQGKDFIADRLRKLAQKRIKHIPKKELCSLYKKMTLIELSRHFGCGQTLIWKKIREYGIPLISRSERLIGKVKTDSHKLRLSLAAFKRNLNGSNNPNYNHGKTLINLSDRFSSKHFYWRKTALRIANNKCQKCGISKGVICDCCGHKLELHVHHIKSFAKYPELRFDLTNAIVLCERCHKKEHVQVKQGELLENPFKLGQSAAKHQNIERSDEGSTVRTDESIMSISALQQSADDMT